MKRPLPTALFCALFTVGSIALNLDPAQAATPSFEKSELKAGETPKQGDKAHPFQLETIAKKKVSLDKLCEKGSVVIALLRGFPGSQCPACSAQVADFVRNAKKFEEANTTVLLIYPGDVKELADKGSEFLQGTTLPENFHFILDPGYKFTNLYGLRWDAPNETAYPSTYAVNQKGIVTYFKTSDTHKGRADAKEVLEALGSK